jgi:hypothetical protein
MVIRRIREHVTAHNWFAVAIDLAIVVLGVIIATQVNNWNEARQDRERGRNYAVRLIEELRTTEQSMRGIKLYYADVRDHALAALGVLRKQGPVPDEPFLVDAYQATQVFPRAARHATYDEILQSGSLELIGPPNLRARLSNYYWRMDGLVSLDAVSPPYRERLRSVLPYEVQQAIRAKCDEIISDLGNGLMSPRLPARCLPGIDPTVAAAAAAQIRAEPALAHDLTRTIIALDTRILNFGRLETNAREVRQYMERVRG